MSKQFIEVINKIKQKNGLDFKLIDGVDIEGILEAPVVPDSESGTTETTLGEYIQNVANGINADIAEHLADESNPHKVKVSQLIDDGNTAFNKNFEEDANNIQMAGTASVGESDTIARADHVHPVDTSRAAQTEVDQIQANFKDLTEDLAEHVEIYNNHVLAFESYQKQQSDALSGMRDQLTTSINNNAALFSEFKAEQEAKNLSIDNTFSQHAEQIDSNRSQTQVLDLGNYFHTKELNGDLTIISFNVQANNTVTLTFNKGEIKLIIDWGDGNIETVTTTAIDGANYTIRHTYENAGTYMCKIDGMTMLSNLFLSVVPAGGNAPITLISRLVLNKMLNLTGANNVFKDCPAAVKIIVPFTELTKYLESGVGGTDNIDAVAFIQDIKKYIDSMLVTSLDEIINKN